MITINKSPEDFIYQVANAVEKGLEESSVKFPGKTLEEIMFCIYSKIWFKLVLSEKHYSQYNLADRIEQGVDLIIDMEMVEANINVNEVKEMREHLKDYAAPQGKEEATASALSRLISNEAMRAIEKEFARETGIPSALYSEFSYEFVA